MDSVQGRDPQRLLDVLAKAEAAAEHRRDDVEAWYEQARGHLSDFALTVQQAGERLAAQVEALREDVSVPGAVPPALTGPSLFAAEEPSALLPSAASLSAPPSGSPSALPSGRSTGGPTGPRAVAAGASQSGTPAPPRQRAGEPEWPTSLGASVIAPTQGIPQDESGDHRGSAYAVVEPRATAPGTGPAHADDLVGALELTDPHGRPPIAAGQQIARATPAAVARPVDPENDPVVASLRAYQARLLADSERAADDRLASAEEQAAQLLTDARAQADQVMRSAKFHAERMIGNAKMESALTARRVAELRALERKLRESIKGMVSGQESTGPTDLDYTATQELTPQKGQSSWMF